ncbi:MAG: FMN-binding protein [Treponema sp.]|jgi:uncharacterized protein with FMN-binding domain|nr:FMN-binding protein [Treponema sp.]
MKQAVKVLRLILMTGILTGCLHFDAGTGFYSGRAYEGIGEGYRGPIRVRVRVGAGDILAIEIIEHSDDEPVGGAAMMELLEAVLDSNAADPDAVSGATESSMGFLAAIDDALKKAALD